MECQLLGQLAVGNLENQHRILNADGIGVIEAAIQTHVAHDGVCQWGCFTMGQLSSEPARSPHVPAFADDDIALFFKSCNIMNNMQRSKSGDVIHWGD